MNSPALLLTAALCATAACRHVPASASEPALLVEPTPAVRAQLREALTEALGAAPAAVADDALTRSSVLVVDRAAQREGARRPLTGRTVDTATVHRFVLVVEDGGCVLTRPADGWRAPLGTAACVAE